MDSPGSCGIGCAEALHARGRAWLDVIEAVPG
jgi:hypothetical protein